MKQRCRQSSYGRSGCLTCKERHKKCDEHKPICKTCARLNLTCRQPDLFRTSNLSRSHPRQVRRDWAASVDLVVELSGQDESNNHLPNHSWIVSPVHDQRTSLFCVEDTIPRPVLSTRGRPLETHLLQHYIERSSVVLLNVDGPQNSLRSIVLPRADVSSMLSDAVYAVSSQHAFISNNNAEYHVAALTYYAKASAGLQHSISDFDDNMSVAERELVLLTSVFFCKYEVVAGGFKNWRSHLQGLHKMLCTFERNEARLAPEVVSYVQSFIAYHWYISGITSVDRCDPQLTTSDLEDDGELEVATGQIDPYMGISTNYIRLLYSAARLVLSSASNFGGILDTVVMLFHSWEVADLDRKELDILLWLHHEASADLSAISEAYKYAVLGYLHIVLDRVSSGQLTDASALRSRRVRSLLPCSKADAISRCVDNIAKVGEESSFSVGLAPLLFIVASDTSDSYEADWAFARLTRLWETSCLGNLGTAVELLSSVRQDDTADWREVLAGKKWDLIVS